MYLVRGIQVTQQFPIGMSLTLAMKFGYQHSKNHLKKATQLKVLVCTFICHFAKASVRFVVVTNESQKIMR